MKIFKYDLDDKLYLIGSLVEFLSGVFIMRMIELVKSLVGRFWNFLRSCFLVFVGL